MSLLIFVCKMAVFASDLAGGMVDERSRFFPNLAWKVATLPDSIFWFYPHCTGQENELGRALKQVLDDNSLKWKHQQWLQQGRVQMNCLAGKKIVWSSSVVYQMIN